MNKVNSQQCIAFSSDQESLLWERKYGLLSLDSMLKWQQQSQDALLWKTTQHHFLSLSQRNKAKNKNRKKRVTCIKHGKLHSTILSMFCPAQGPLPSKKIQWHKSGDFNIKWRSAPNEKKKQKQKKKRSHMHKIAQSTNTGVTNNTACLSSKSTNYILFKNYITSNKDN